MAAVVIAEAYLLDFLRYYPSSSQMYQDVETRMFSSASGRIKKVTLTWSMWFSRSLKVFCLIDSGKIFKLDFFWKFYWYFMNFAEGIWECSKPLTVSHTNTVALCYCNLSIRMPISSRVQISNYRIGVIRNNNKSCRVRAMFPSGELSQNRRQH